MPELCVNIKMIERIKRLTDFQEAILVIIIGLGLFIYASLHGLFIISTGTSKVWTYFLNENASISILVIELTTLPIIGFILFKRGWTFNNLNLNISLRIFVDAVLVLFAYLLVGALVVGFFVLVLDIDRETSPSLQFVYHKNYFIWGLILVINSVFEEFIYVGYLSRKLEAQNKGLFVIVSATMRTVIHLYQGIFAIIPHFITGLVFAAYYTKFRQLTVLIIAHALLNLLILWRAS
jgi:membrane protease YdiL (CAAX protease family)